MRSETSPTTSKAVPSTSADELWAEEWLAERMKPSRQRNLTPLQRQQRLGALRLNKLANSPEMRADMSKRGIDVVVR